MGYYNPIYRYGAEAFARDAVAAGVDGADRRRPAARGGCRAGRAGARRRARLHPPRHPDQRRRRACRRSSSNASGFHLLRLDRRHHRHPLGRRRRASRPRSRGCAASPTCRSRSASASGPRSRRPQWRASPTPRWSARRWSSASPLNLDPDGRAKPGLVDARARPWSRAGRRRARRAGTGASRHELAHQLRPAEDPGAGRARKARCPDNLWHKCPACGADDLPSRARGEPARLPALRPSPAASAPASGCELLFDDGDFDAHRAAEDRGRPAASSATASATPTGCGSAGRRPARQRRARRRRMARSAACRRSSPPSTSSSWAARWAWPSARRCSPRRGSRSCRRRR